VSNPASDPRLLYPRKRNAGTSRTGDWDGPHSQSVSYVDDKKTSPLKDTE